MAKLDYYAIEQAIHDAIVSDPLGDGVAVQIETELAVIEGPTVVIYLDRRDAPADLQALAAGTTTRFLLYFSIWCLDISLDGLNRACELRDDLLGTIEVILMKNRTLGGTVLFSWLEGGDFDSGESPGGTGFVSAAEIRLVADAKATTT